VSARVSALRKLAGTTWGASHQVLKTSCLALAFSPAEYCSPVWVRSSHTSKVDSALNASMRVVIGCLRSTPSFMLPTLAGITPPSIRRSKAILELAGRAESDDSHLLHDCLEERQLSRLKSRHPFRKHAAQLCEELDSMPTGLWERLKVVADFSTPSSRLCRFMHKPSGHPPGCNLDYSTWTKLNRLRSGTGRVAAVMHVMGLAETPLCNCGQVQTTDHLMTCPLIQSSITDRDVMEVNEAALRWLDEVEL